jgi:hypothetical protein
MLKSSEENVDEVQRGTSMVLIHTIDKLSNLHVRLRICSQNQEGEVHKSTFNDHIH